MLYFHADRLPHYPTYEHWNLQRRHLSYHSDFKLGEAYETYRSLYQDETSLAGNGIIRANLCSLFKLSPRLDCIEICLQESRKGCQSWRQAAYHDAMVAARNDEDPSPSRHEALTETLLAAHDVKRKIRRLSAAEIPHGFFAQSPATMAQFGQVLDKLEALHLDLKTTYCQVLLGRIWIDDIDLEQYNVMLEVLRNGGFVRFMSHCPQIRRLHVKHPSIGNGEWRRMPLRDMVGSFTFLNLASLELDTCESTQEDLQNFLLRHSETLRKVRLDSLCLTTGRWGAFFAAISGKFPLMKRGPRYQPFTIRGIFRATHREDIYGFTAASNGQVNMLTLRMEQYVRWVGRQLPLQSDDPRDYPSDEEVYWYELGGPGDEESDSEGLETDLDGEESDLNGEQSTSEGSPGLASDLDTVESDIFAAFQEVLQWV